MSTAPKRARVGALALGAVGVVYGDIGTSPLYTIKAIFSEEGIAPSHANVLGALSLIFWALIIVVSLKYLLFILRADNKGEGGIMALLALAQRSVRQVPRLRLTIIVLGIFGAALFYGDGVITPAISVLSAVEGLEIAAPALQPWVIPLTIVVIVALFSVQRQGTGRIGSVFGPVCVVWFISIASLGVLGIARHPEVLHALNPAYGVAFFVTNRINGFLALGAVVLAVTGTEALYADMGHFGKRPIQLAWFNFVLPALVLNYFGQGAQILADPAALANPFYYLVPKPLLYPMIALATAATVIASQAVISGAFSMTREAMQLGYMPRMRIVHTSQEVAGQVFMPWINRLLMVLVVAAVVGFGSSDRLGAAYGIAVTGTMVITTLLALVVARYQWRWDLPWIALVGVPLLIVDVAFFSANLVKIAYGGWFPLALGVLMFGVMNSWRRGRERVVREIQQNGQTLQPFLRNLAEYPILRVPGTAVFLTASASDIPPALLHNLKHNKVLHDRNVLLTVETLEVPTAEVADRYEWTPLVEGFARLQLRFGYAEDADIPSRLATCTRAGIAFDLMETTFFVSREKVIAQKRGHGMMHVFDTLFAFMSHNALSATAFFNIPENRRIELGSSVEI
ncbi:MAG: potassium transporter Kup [Pseudomonadota bacterium]|nr:potassium transporter Kup [Pseudomonadota bacterium]